jgi:hypothetical protein
MHRLHRALGSVLSLLIVLWFVSGAVMTFAGYPYLSEAERLMQAPSLPAELQVEFPPELMRFFAEGALARGGEVRLSLLEAVPTWLYSDRATPVAFRTAAPFAVAPLDDLRVRAEAARRFGLPIDSTELLTEFDQWTVAFARKSVLPLYRVRFADAARTEVYLSAATGETLQVTTRGERALAWVGAIPHWIYPTVLRRERALWRSTVLVLASLGLLLTLSGTAAGLHVSRTLKKRGVTPRDPYLRWHQTLGLWFGLFASSWLFSGAMSLSPFHWTGERGETALEQDALYGAGAGLSPSAALVSVALHSCQRELSVRELALRALGGRVYAVCMESATNTRLVDLADASLSVSTTVALPELESVAARLAGPSRTPTLTVLHAYDAYHYPTHTSPEAALPFVTIALQDEDESTYYLDPARALPLRRHTARTRLERWLYQGLHCFDLPGLYQQRALWRTLMIAAMVVGATLSGLGLAMVVRRWRRGAAQRRRKEVATGQDVSAEMVFRE